MAQTARLAQWETDVATHMPHLRRSFVRLLAWYSFGMVIAQSCGCTTVSVFLAHLLDMRENTVRQRLREWSYEATAKRGRLRPLAGRGTAWLPIDHDRHVARTFTLSYDRLDPATPTDALARDLLARAACFVPNEPIPHNLLLTTLRIGKADHDPLDAADALRRLHAVGLLEPIEQTSTIHHLVARFVHGIHPTAEAQNAVEQVINSVTYELLKTGYPAPLVTIQPHLRFITDRALEREDIPAASLASNLADHLDW
ncbi:MAG: hypothetical protein H0T53_06070 [Herpetosiphonaceae bacterium]|nr:hypothetical protein [Herpetosiphonaceae bacterium]